MNLPRLDILLYAHDGRGLGHASRSIGIGMALRRLFPRLRVLLVTGCRQAGELIDRTPLDWLKLPSYETRIEEGRSRGINGKSGFTDQELARIRTRSLREIVRLYRPRLVLVDHQPQGKHRELVPAITESDQTTWVLGIRGVVGGVDQVRSDGAAALFRDHFHALLWYGDSRVLGPGHRQELEKRFGKAIECGYVSRLTELAPWRAPTDDLLPPLAGTVSIPWLSEGSRAFLGALAAALQRLKPTCGRWRIFADIRDDPVAQLFAAVEHCSIEPPGPRYVDSLRNSRMALIYGGYNSLVDILATGRPAVVVLRPMQDREQQQHLELLRAHTGDALVAVAEQDATPALLADLLAQQLQLPIADHGINLQGAQQAARELVRLLS